MNIEYTNKLFTRFSFLFKNKNDISQSCMSFGFECGNGWFHLLWDTFLAIEKILQKDNETYKDFYIIQVKTKFGGLRIYCSAYFDNIDEIINIAEKKSYKICEICGKPGNLRTLNSWCVTLCDIHYNNNLQYITKGE